MTTATWDLAALAALVTAIASALVLLAKFLARTRDAQDEGTGLLRDLSDSMANVRRDIGGIRQELRQLAGVDEADRARADDNHRHIWGELTDHEQRLQVLEDQRGICRIPREDADQ